jgi:DNA-directed RNA polymerase subunit RPC12/RpoP
MDIMTLFSGLSAATKAARDLNEVRDLANSADGKLKLASIVDALAEAKIALSDYKEKVASLEKEIEELKKRNSDIDKLERRGALFIDVMTGIYKCTTCIEKDKMVITLNPDRYEDTYEYQCNRCNSKFRSPDWKEPPPIVYESRGRGLI